MSSRGPNGTTTLQTAALISIVRVAALWFLLVQAVVAAEPKNVLVIYSNNRLVPGNIAVDRGLRAALTDTPGNPPVQIFSEFLDRPEFSGEAYELTLTTYLREKYATHRPDAIVVVSDDALGFVLHQRAHLFRVSRWCTRPSPRLCCRTCQRCLPGWSASPSSTTTRAPSRSRCAGIQRPGDS